MEEKKEVNVKHKEEPGKKPEEPAKVSDENLTDEKTKAKQNKQIFWAIVLIAAIIVIIIFIPIIKTNFLNKFNYQGLVFQHTQMGKIDFYSTKVPMTKITPSNGSLIKKSQISGHFALDLRNDPRVNKNISIEVLDNRIGFIKDGIVYITFDSDDPACPQNVISAVTITNFLIDFAGLKLSGATTDKNYSIATKTPYITCDTTRENTVIWFHEGEENKVKKIRSNCYELTYKDCDMLPVAEKFVLEILKGYMEYFEK